MVDIATNSNDSPDTVHAELPEWYKIAVCLGSAVVGGFFGAVYEFFGILMGSVGGIGVALLWLNWVAKFHTPSVLLRILYGIGMGIYAGLIDTAWLHTTGLLRISASGPYDFFLFILIIAFFCGVFSGAAYGLICMIILEVHRARVRRKPA
ncbi:MAG: hypothetical protein HN350_11265 [Phycisphaerales bacterium]|jgi:hypothetical protein|nr:hypothetical protein [Phycisphaerales bacterium]